MSSSVVLRDTIPFFSSASTGVVAALTFFFLAKYIYRLTFHPLATFPGPRLAALTSLYGASYDLLPNRSYCIQFPALHDTYGPIVRVFPNQLHIRDIDAYNQIFKIGTKFDKHFAFYNNPALRGSYFPIPSAKTALARKSMHSPLFSKEAVRRSEHLITDMLFKFLNTLSGYASGTSPVDLSMGLKCLSSETAMNFAFQRPFNALDAEGFQSELVQGVDALARLSQWSTYFPKFFGVVSWVTECLPEWFISRFMRPFALITWCLEVSRQQIAYLQQRSPSEEEIHTVFDINLNPNLEKGQFTPTTNEMAADALALLVGGTHTTSSAMVVTIWALLNNPQVMQRLKTELKAAMPRRDDVMDWAELEKLPYLRAVIREGLRLSYGAPGRLPRVVPPSGAIFCGQKIPPGTLVSSSSCVYHQDPTAFPSPQTFQPARWLPTPTTDPREPDSKFMPFSKGSRMCVAAHLAHAEMALLLAHLLRRFELSNAGTTAADMRWDDCIILMIRGPLMVRVGESGD